LVKCLTPDSSRYDLIVQGVDDAAGELTDVALGAVRTEGGTIAALGVGRAGPLRTERAVVVVAAAAAEGDTATSVGSGAGVDTLVAGTGGASLGTDPLTPGLRGSSSCAVFVLPDCIAT